MTPFSPLPLRTVNIDVSSSSQNIKISDTPRIRQVRVMNNGTATVWVDFGNSSSAAAAVATGFPVGPGVTEVLTSKITDGPLYAAAIAAGSTGKIYFTPGSGS